MISYFIFHFLFTNIRGILLQIIPRFTKIFYGLETQHVPLTIVPLGLAADLNNQDQLACFCNPPDSEAIQNHRDRAETLVEPPSPKFSDISEVGTVLLHFLISKSGILSNCIFFLQIEEMLKMCDIELIVYNIVIGNQIVVRGQHPVTIESIILILVQFLPKNCVVNFGYGTLYEPCYSCQFLGLPLNVDVPISGQILVIDVMSKVERPRELRCFMFEVKKYPELHKISNPSPRILEEICSLITLSRSHEHETYNTALKAVLQKWSSKAISYFLAMKTMEDAIPNKAKLLSILEAGDNDIPVLTFFRGSLKHPDKNRLLNEVQ